MSNNLGNAAESGFWNYQLSIAVGTHPHYIVNDLIDMFHNPLSRRK